MDINPFAPPRTTELDGPEAAVGPERRALEPEAVEALVSAGKWAQVAAALGAGWVGLSLIRSLFIVLGQQFRDGAVSTLVGNAIAIPVIGLLVWLTRRFGTAARGLGQLEAGAADEVMEAQARLFKAHGILATVFAVLAALAVGVGFFAGRWTGR